MSGFFESKFNLVNTLFKNVSWYITQKLNKRDVLENPWTAVFVPNQYKTQMMWETAVEAYPWLIKICLHGHNSPENVWQSCRKETHGYWNSFLISIRPTDV